MSQKVDYSAMSRAELKQYFLRHREDHAAFQAYLDRINQKPRRIIASPGDPDFDEKVVAAIRRQMAATQKAKSQSADPVPTDSVSTADQSGSVHHP